MKTTSTMNAAGITNLEIGFENFVESLRPSLKLWDYFVNWDKVFRNTREIEIHLNLWNFLLGKEDFDVEFNSLLTEHPQIVKALPSLVVRDGQGSSRFSVIQNIKELSMAELQFDFSINASTPELRASALVFVKESGLIRLFAKDGVKNLVDYVLGVEAGVDSNGRKNRSGTSMETVVGEYLQGFATGRGLEFITQATASSIKAKWGFVVPVDKSSRRYDFAISDGKKLVLMEVNFYGGGGSKLKATAGEFIGLGELLNLPNVDFVWVTDGKGWLTTLNPMRAAFEKLDYVWNLNWLSKDFLADLFEKEKL
jgi:type II restriction enzyme